MSSSHVFAPLLRASAASCSAVRPTATTLCVAASSRTMAEPMPPVAPVTMASGFGLGTAGSFGERRCDRVYGHLERAAGYAIGLPQHRWIGARHRADDRAEQGVVDGNPAHVDCGVALAAGADEPACRRIDVDPSSGDLRSVVSCVNREDARPASCEQRGGERVGACARIVGVHPGIDEHAGGDLGAGDGWRGGNEPRRHRRRGWPRGR